MDTGHPTWFYPSSFGHNVLTYSLRKIGFFSPLEGEMNLEPRRNEDEEESAIRIIGNAVFTLQVLLRRRLGAFFITSISLINDPLWTEGVEEMFDFMAQGYMSKNIFETILSNFAIIAELIVFMRDFGIPISNYSYSVLWCNIYSHRLKVVLSNCGGFRELVDVAKRKYMDTGLYQETLMSFLRNDPVQHAEKSTLDNWPEDIEDFLVDSLGAFPGPENRIRLAMNILRQLYARKRGLVPTEEEEQLWLLPY